MGTAVCTVALAFLVQPGLAQTEPSTPTPYHTPARPAFPPSEPLAAPSSGANAPAPAAAATPATGTAAPAAAPQATPPATSAANGTASSAPAPEGAATAAPASSGQPAGGSANAAAPAPGAEAKTPAQQAPGVPLADADGEYDEVPDSTLPHDLSPWGMFMAADWVVKAVMIGLAFASVVTWTVWFGKSLQLVFARRTVRRTLDVLREAPTLAEAATLMPKGRGPAQATVIAALDEWKSSASLPAEGVKERVAVALNRIEAAAGRRMISGTGLLATIGATAPFVGLFGTVWGIMNSFIGISKAQTTNLAIVAPGIAEALLATAIGLVAAIPAVVIYNMFARSIAGYKANISDCSAEVMRHLSRDLDREGQAGKARSVRAAAE
ncbi:tonB-system energizer ExbB [Xanthobacter sp. TB0136]|uniref:tonB-system energizer ExbB n=1 Tax=Xanthobacter sp. TB0136 TaxID=3459177 RepID=UPI004039C8E6